MYCKRCYADLSQVTESSSCPRCGQLFDHARPSSCLPRPFFPLWKMAIHIIATTLVALWVAYTVAVFQLNAVGSGH